MSLKPGSFIFFIIKKMFSGCVLINLSFKKTLEKGKFLIEYIKLGYKKHFLLQFSCWNEGLSNMLKEVPFQIVFLV